MTMVMDSGIETLLPGIELLECYADERCTLYYMGGKPSVWNLGMYFLLAPEGYRLGASLPDDLVTFCLTDHGEHSYLSPIEVNIFIDAVTHLRGKYANYCVVTAEKGSRKELIFPYQTGKGEQFPHKIIQPHTRKSIEDCLKLNIQVSAGNEIYDHHAQKKYPQEFEAHQERAKKLNEKGHALITELSDLFDGCNNMKLLQSTTLDPQDKSGKYWYQPWPPLRENFLKQLARLLGETIAVTGDQLGQCSLQEINETEEVLRLAFEDVYDPFVRHEIKEINLYSLLTASLRITPLLFTGSLLYGAGYLTNNNSLTIGGAGLMAFSAADTFVSLANAGYNRLKHGAFIAPGIVGTLKTFRDKFLK